MAIALRDFLLNEELISHMKAAFPPKPYVPGMSLDEVAFNQGAQAPIEHLEHLLRKKNTRGR